VVVRPGAGRQCASAALLDRLLHHAQVITTKGERYRLKDKKKAGLIEVKKAETKAPTRRRAAQLHR